MSLKKNVVSNYIGNFLAVIVNFSLVPIYLKYLSVEEYGIITFFGTITSVFVILDMGLGLTVNKEIATSIAKKESKKETGDVIRTFEIIYWLVAIFIGCILLFASNLIAENWLNVEEISYGTLSSIISLMGVALLFRWPISFYNNSLSGFQKMVNLNVIKSIVFIVNIVSILLLFNFFEIRVKGVFNFFVFLYLFNTILLVYSVWSSNNVNFFKSKFRINILKKAKKFILSIGLFSILGTIFTLLDKIVISKFFSTEDLGYYSLVSMMSLVLLQLVYPVSSALFPKFVENYTKSEHENSFRVFRKGYHIIITLVFSVSSILIFFRREILFLWTQNENVATNSVVYFSPLIFGTIFYTLHVLIISIYTSIGKTKAINYLYITISIFYLVLLSISVLNNNLLWIAYSWTIVNFLLLLGSLYLGSIILGKERIMKFLIKDLLLPILLLSAVYLLSNLYVLPKLSLINILAVIIGSSALSFISYALMTPYPWLFIKKR